MKKIYNSLILGSSYTQAGYAIAKKNCIVCEEGESADTTFYLALKNFKIDKISPKTKLGQSLFNIYFKLNLFKNGMQNLNGFECGFCDFLLQNDVKILFKTKRIDTVKEGRIYKTRIMTVGGIKTIYSKEIIDLKAPLNKPSNEQVSRRWTILYYSKNPDCAKERLLQTFKGATVEPAFFQDRYAIHLPVNEYSDFNQMKLDVFNKWKESKPDCEIVYMSPATYYTSTNTIFPQDFNYNNPVDALETGFKYAKEKEELK